jgi:glycosyltransferase involved in cell wall biosynthesis
LELYEQRIFMGNNLEDKTWIVFDGRFFIQAEQHYRSRTGIFHVSVGLLRALNERDDVDLQIIGCDNCSQNFKSNDLGLPDYNFRALVRQRRPAVFLSTLLEIDEQLRNSAQVVPYLVVHDVWAHVLNMRETQAYSFEEKLVSSISPRTAIATVSQATRNDLRRLFNIPTEQMTVIYPGIRSDWENTNTQTGQRAEITGLPFDARYLLCLSTLEPRKNLLTSLKAFERVTELEEKANFSDKKRTYLVIVGADGWGNQAELVSSLSHEARSRTVFTGYLTDSAVKAVIKRAVCLIHPALYEGFGLPVLEAQHLGTPVITSNRGALQEVAGIAGVLLDPMDHEGFAIAAFRLLSDAGYRSCQSDLGKIQAKKFSYTKTAAALITHPFMLSQLKIARSMIE